MKVSILEVAFHRECIDDRPVPPCFMVFETEYQRFRSRETPSSDTTWKRSWANETFEFQVKHQNDIKLRFEVVAVLGPGQVKPVAVNDISMESLCAQPRTERWMCLDNFGLEGAPKASYLRFRSVWAPSEAALEPATAETWDGDMLFTDGTTDAKLTEMMRKRGKGKFHDASHMKPLLPFKPKVSTGLDPHMGAPVHFTEEMKDKMTAASMNSSATASSVWTKLANG